MATLTIPIDSELLQAAQRAAEARHTTLEELLASYVADVAGFRDEFAADDNEPLWIPGVTRSQTYAQRGMKADFNPQAHALQELTQFARTHPFQLDLKNVSRAELNERDR